MKLIKILGHPVVLIISYLLLIIEGDNFGGFYMLYLILALPHGAIYALLAAFGLLCEVIGLNIQPKQNVARPYLYLVGFVFMICSLVLFFSKGNKWATFELPIPLLTFILFGLLSLFFLTAAISLWMEAGGRKNSIVPVLF